MAAVRKFIGGGRMAVLRYTPNVADVNVTGDTAAVVVVAIAMQRLAIAWQNDMCDAALDCRRRRTRVRATRYARSIDRSINESIMTNVKCIMLAAHSDDGKSIVHGKHTRFGFPRCDFADEKLHAINRC